MPYTAPIEKDHILDVTNRFLNANENSSDAQALILDMASEILNESVDQIIDDLDDDGDVDT